MNFERLSALDTKFWAFSIRTSSGRKCSINDVSTSPPWMPYCLSCSLIKPSGWPKRPQWVQITAIWWRTRNSRPTMLMMSALPP
ncbi:hypothetical protein D3C87_1931590 [compost metagenome]